MTFDRPSWSVSLLLLGLAQAPTAPPKPLDVVNQVQGRTAILTLKPAGTRVKQGDLLVELDSARFREALLAQQVETHRAEGEYQTALAQAKIASSRAEEIAEELTGEQESYELLAQVAAIDVKIAEEEVVQAKLDQELGRGSPEQVGAALAKRSLADDRLNKAKAKVKSFKTSTKKTRTSEIAIELEQAQNEEAARLVIRDLERKKEQRLRLQIERCRIVSPAAGMVLSANPEEPQPGRPWIEEGALVRERQVLLRIQPEENPPPAGRRGGPKTPPSPTQ